MTTEYTPTEPEISEALAKLRFYLDQVYDPTITDVLPLSMYADLWALNVCRAELVETAGSARRAAAALVARDRWAVQEAAA